MRQHHGCKEVNLKKTSDGFNFLVEDRHEVVSAGVGDETIERTARLFRHGFDGGKYIGRLNYVEGQQGHVGEAF